MQIFVVNNSEISIAKADPMAHKVLELAQWVSVS